MQLKCKLKTLNEKKILHSFKVRLALSLDIKLLFLEVHLGLL